MKNKRRILTSIPFYSENIQKTVIAISSIGSAKWGTQYSNARVAHDHEGDNSSDGNFVCPKLQYDVEGDDLEWDECRFEDEKVDGGGESEGWVYETVGEPHLWQQS